MAFHLIEQKFLANRELAASNIKQGLPQDTGFDNDVITSEDVGTSSLPDFKTPEDQSFSDISQFEPEITEQE